MSDSYRRVEDLKVDRRGGRWCFEKGAGRRRSRIYVRCIHCRKINDMARVDATVRYFDPSPSAIITTCWSCRYCYASFTGATFEGWSMSVHHDKNPFSPDLPELDRLLCGTAVYMIGPRNAGAFGWEIKLFEVNVGTVSIYKRSIKNPIYQGGHWENRTPTGSLKAAIRLSLEVLYKNHPNRRSIVLDKIRENAEAQLKS